MSSKLRRTPRSRHRAHVLRWALGVDQGRASRLQVDPEAIGLFLVYLSLLQLVDPLAAELLFGRGADIQSTMIARALGEQGCFAPASEVPTAIRA